MTPAKIIRRYWWIAGLLVLAGLGALAWERSGYGWQDAVDALAGFDPAVAIALMAVLPVAGFSISVVYLVAGAKFGPVLGGVVVTGVTAVHLLASYWIAHTVLRDRIERYLEKRRHRLPHVPEGENISVAVMAVLVPGLPYVVRNYLLALTDVPFRVYFWVCLPLYVARSYVTILLGDLGTAPDARTLVVLATVYAVKLSICAYLLWRIRRRLKQRRKTGAIAGSAAERRVSP